MRGFGTGRAHTRGGLPPWLTLAVVLAVSACDTPPANLPSTGTSPTCKDPAAHSASSGPFASPADFERAGCTPGALADFDPSGIWTFVQDNHGIFSGAGTLRFETSCEDGLEVELGASIASVEITDRLLSADDLFWRRVREFDDGATIVIDAQNFCGLNGEGELTGQAVTCVGTAEGTECEASPVVARRLDRLAGEDVASGLELVSELSGAAWSWRHTFSANVRVHGDIAFLARDEDGLRVVDVSDLEHPREIAHVPAFEGERLNDLKIIEDDGRPYVLVASNDRGMLVFDVEDPSEPELVVAVTPTGDPNHGIHTVFVEDIDGSPMAYLADGFSNLVTIWNLETPEIPERVGAFEAGDPTWAVHDLFVEAGRMYLNATTGGMIVVDTQPDPADPQWVGQYLPQDEVRYSHSNWVTAIGGRRISVHGDEGFDAHFRTIDVDPESPTFMMELGQFQTRPEISAHNVMAFGSKAYAAYYQDGVRILDLSDPAAPLLKAYYNTWEPRFSRAARFEGAVGIDVDVDRGIVFVADYPRGLMILRELDP